MCQQLTTESTPMHKSWSRSLGESFRGKTWGCLAQDHYNVLSLGKADVIFMTGTRNVLGSFGFY